MDRFEIIDDQGVIYSGTEIEMMEQWEKITNQEDDIEWTGDLRLVKVVSIFR